MAAGDALLIAAGAVCALISAQSIDLPSHDVRVADVVSLDCVALPQRDDIGKLVIASVTREQDLTREALGALVRRRVPALATLDFGAAADATIRLRPAQAARANTLDCYAARTAISRGAAVSSDDVERAPCRPEVGQRAPIRYDRMHGVMRAAADIAAGDPLGRLMPPPASVTEEGQQLTLTIAVGPVTIQRPVEALQTSLGATIFVRDRDGHVFSAPIAPEDDR